MNYWDTSALVKLYVTEPDSAYFLALVAAASTSLRTSDLARVEVYSTFSRKETAGELAAGRADQLFESFLSHLHSGRLAMVPVGTDVLAHANALIKTSRSQDPPLLIRSFDAVHVASAVVAGSRTMVATDLRLRAVAAQAGLALLP